MDAAMKLTTIMATFLGALVALPAIGRAEIMGYCKTYVQISSNAGKCPTCKISLSPGPIAGRIVVTANNDWSAEVTVKSGQTNIASGAGSWAPGTDKTYAGKNFGFDMVRSGNRLAMSMKVIDGKVVRNVLAKFVCSAPETPAI